VGLSVSCDPRNTLITASPCEVAIRLGMYSMKLRRVLVENVRSFLDPAELLMDGDISIIIGPNGGGKTNLLDTATTAIRKYLLTSWAPIKNPTPEIPDRYEFRSNETIAAVKLETHSQGKGREQKIEIEVEVTARDIENILAMRDSAREIHSKTQQKYINVSSLSAESWDVTTLRAGMRLQYTIINEGLQHPADPAAFIFFQYLQMYEADSYLRESLGMSKLTTPMIFMPVNRAASSFQSSVSLAGYNERDYKKGVDAANSRSAASFMTLAIGRIARRYRLLLEDDNQNAKTAFNSDPEMLAITSILKDLGYEWELTAVDPLKNEYDIKLTKQGTAFLVTAASSGEKELLTYLFSIYALNIRDALIVIDEPELHLHPRWQAILLGLFERLSTETRNQFLLATHSPVFVSPASIHYVSRVFSHDQKSAIVRLSSDTLPDPKHLFAIVNSQNNEKMFFADKVVLVEGISDRLFFDAVLNKFGVNAGTNGTCEVVSVGGKTFFAPYLALLKACKVVHAVIADFDYLEQIGTPQVKSLFSCDHKKLADSVVAPASKDGNSLVSVMEECLATSDFVKLRELWEYIKQRHSRLPNGLSADEMRIVLDCISNVRADNVFVLQKGSLENYLPDGHRSKDLDKLIRLLNEDFWIMLSTQAQAELEDIALSIAQL
jgi:putative ATP-dependent endonuclease of OLD family